MKKSIWVKGLVACSLLALTGCEETYPEKTDQGVSWNKEWTIIGPNLGIDDFGHGFTLLESPVVLAGDDTFYGTWCTGEKESYVNEEGKDTDLYAAELYVLDYGCGDGSYAAKQIDEFLERQKEKYEILETYEEVHNGQTYTLISYNCISESNPYTDGITAFTVNGRWAIALELDRTERYSEDLKSTMNDVLDHTYYAAE